MAITVLQNVTYTTTSDERPSFVESRCRRKTKGIQYCIKFLASGYFRKATRETAFYGGKRPADGSTYKETEKSIIEQNLAIKSGAA